VRSHKGEEFTFRLFRIGLKGQDLVQLSLELAGISRIGAATMGAWPYPLRYKFLYNAIPGFFKLF